MCVKNESNPRNRFNEWQGSSTLQGDPNQKTVYSDDPISIAKKWEASGADMIHLVDLDATLGLGSNLELIKKIVSSVSIPIEIAGGLRSESLILEALDIVDRVVIGTFAFKEPELLQNLLTTLGPEKIVISVDHKDGYDCDTWMAKHY